MLRIEKTRDGKTLTIALDGKLDTSTAPQLEKELDLTDTEKLIFELKDLAYISSAGLRILLAALKTMNGQGGMTVRHVSPEVAEIFEVTGFHEILTIEADDE